MSISGPYVNGQFVATARTVSVTNPATDELLGEVSVLDQSQVRDAICGANEAFESWRKLSALTRGNYLRAIAREMDRRADEIARIITLENGKPLAQSKGEVAMSVDHLCWFAEEARRAYGRVIPNQIADKRHLVIKSPIGVVGAISPWNFPLVLAVRKIAPALAAGCTVVFKPAMTTPLCAIALAECVESAKLPSGAFQLVLGDAGMIGDEMLANALCRKMTFTGSTEVGKQLIAKAARHVKRLALELGGHAPLLIFDDADLDRAIDGAMLAKFRNNGQSCIAANRILVQNGIYPRFVERFVEATRALRVGNGLAPQTEIGPLIGQEALESALVHIDDALQLGGKLQCGGQRWGNTGFFLEPTVITDVSPESRCFHEETFAPVAPIARFEDEEMAIGLANRSTFGLAAYAFTENLDRALRVMERLDAGTVGINDGLPSTSIAPFGGFHHSGWGRELGSEGLDAFLETKHVSIGVKQ